MCNNAVDAACRTEAPSLAAKAVMLVLAHHKNFRSGLCCVSGATLAKEAQQDIRTVRRSIAALEEAALIRVLPKFRRGQREEVNRYILTFASGHSVRAMQDEDHALDAEEIDVILATSGDNMSERDIPQGGAGARGSGAGVSESGATPQEPPLTTREEESSDGENAVVRGADVKAIVEVIWAKASQKGRERSSKADIETAVRASLKRGNTDESILAGMRGYFESDDATKDDGAYQKGAHRMIARDRFLAFIPAKPDPRHPHDDEVGTMERPGVELQRGWMRLHREGRTWNPERGPEPGREGCRVDPAIQREFGVEPFGGWTGSGAGALPDPPSDDDLAAHYGAEADDGGAFD